MIINGWNLLPLNIFNKLYRELALSVIKLREKNPDTYKTHPKTKLLACIQRAIKVDVPENPDNKIFRLGNTLDAKYSHWRRVKQNMPPRYRMFFRFRSDCSESKDSQCIIFAWFNDEFTLRKAGAKSDVYNVFKALLVNNTIPNNWNDLFKDAKEEESRQPLNL